MPDLSAGATSLSGLATYVLVAAGVLVLLGIVLWLARRSNGGAVVRKAAPARRLAVIDEIALDEKRRLVLIQRDGVQHLVILGGANELLVETGIGETRLARFNERELRAPEPAAREVPELPAFPTAPARDATVRDLPPLAAPSVERAARQAALPEPVLPSFAEPALPRRAAAAAEAPAPIRPAAPRSEPPRPQPAPLPPIVRRAEPAPPIAQQAAPTIQPAPAIPQMPVIPPMPEPVLRAEPEPVRPAEASFAMPAVEPAAVAPEPETPAQAAESARVGGLLARLRRPRQSEAAAQAPTPAEPALAPLRDPEPAAAEPRLGSLDRPDLLPEMPSHSVPEVVLDPPTALEPEPQLNAATAAARAEPDMAKLLDMIVPTQEAPTPTAPASAAAPVAPASPIAPASPVAPTAPAGTASPAGPAAPGAGDAAEAARVAVKIDPFFANMAQRLEETLRRPITPGAPTTTPSPPQARPATNAAEIERVIDRALSAPAEPTKSAPATTPPAAALPPRAPEVAPPTRDELEAEMANLLGRGR